MPAKRDITIRFCLNKGEGEYVKHSKFLEEEILDIRKFLSLGTRFRVNEGITLAGVQMPLPKLHPVAHRSRPRGFRTKILCAPLNPNIDNHLACAHVQANPTDSLRALVLKPDGENRVSPSTLACPPLQFPRE